MVGNGKKCLAVSIIVARIGKRGLSMTVTSGTLMSSRCTSCTNDSSPCIAPNTVGATIAQCGPLVATSSDTTRV